MTSPRKVRCRPIGPPDLRAVAALLAHGFPARPLAYWSGGLERLARRDVPDGFPRFGFMLEADGTPVGAILLIAQTITHQGPPFVRCNLASWYVDPAYRGHAAMLSMMPLRSKADVYLNVSAAPNTWPTIEAQGFVRYTIGQRLILPVLGRGDRTLRARLFDPADPVDLPEARLLADHADTGCLSVVGQAPEGPVPFVFLPSRFKQGRFWFPGVQLVYCRDGADVVRFAAPLGRLLVARGRPFVLVDDAAAWRRLPGITFADRGRKYARGGPMPRLGDLAYTEFTIFGG